MGVERCAYGTCRSDSRFAARDYMEGVFFVRFPKPKTQPEKCERWVRACSRGDNFGVHRVKQDTYICSHHFVDGNGPTLAHPDPIPATARGIEIRIFEEKKLRPPPKCRPPQTLEGNANEIDKASKRNRVMIETATQTDVCMEHIRKYTDKALIDKNYLKRQLFMEDVLENDESCKFYTGLVSIQVLMYVFDWIKVKAEKLRLRKGEFNENNQITKDAKRALSTFEAFVLVLVRLRRGMDMAHLADVFGISQSTVSRKWVLDKVQPGDDIMADRGFVIRDLLALRGATLNIPPFAHGKQLSTAAVTKTRRIASARIHVERAKEL
ncbi:uncharacterized protein LOC144436508 [Glandiceps talaboti]